MNGVELAPRVAPAPTLSPGSRDARLADLDAKQELVAELLDEVGCEGLLVFEPENVAWLTSGASAPGILNPIERPAVWFSHDQRRLVAGNADSQRIFDEEVDDLRFQLKEWPWHWGRDQLLHDMCQGRVVASDAPFGDCKPIPAQLAAMRRTLSPYEQSCTKLLGQWLSHALEATCRTMSPNLTEREIAGQLCHRLVHRGIQPVSIHVAADGRSATYRRGGATDHRVTKQCVLTATGKAFGLHATASRSVVFGAPDAQLRTEYDTVCKITATYASSAGTHASPAQVFDAGRKVYQLGCCEFDWYGCPQGHLTGRLPVELTFTPQISDPLRPGWAIVWNACVGSACSCDTFLLTPDSIELATPSESWSIKRIRIQGLEVARPYFLVR